MFNMETPTVKAEGKEPANPQFLASQKVEALYMPHPHTQDSIERL